MNTIFLHLSPLYNSITFLLLVTYRNIVPPIPCSFPFYTTIAFKSYMPLTLSERKFLYLLFSDCMYMFKHNQ